MAINWEVLKVDDSAAARAYYRKRERERLNPERLRDETWKEHAACKGAPLDMFFPPPGSRRTEDVAAVARAHYCTRCPVDIQCEIYAREWDEVGIWGGKTERGRRGQG